MKKIPISMLCIRRNLGSRKSQKAVKIQEHTYKASTIKEPAKENPEAAKKLLPFMVALTDHEQFTDVTKDCSKARRNFLFAAAPWSTLSFLREGNVSNSTCKELPVCLQRWPVQKLLLLLIITMCSYFFSYVEYFQKFLNEKFV